MRRFLRGLYSAAYAFIYTGWFFHHSGTSGLWPYTRSYTVFLAGMTLPFLFPFLFSRLFSKISRRMLIFALTPLLLLSLTAYAAGSLHYSWTTRHPFDPYLQAQLPQIEKVESAKPAGTFRILCLGGSTTQSDDLAPIDRYPARLQAALQKKFPEIHFEVFNAGQAWYTTKHSLIGYVTHYRRWKPDLIIILHGINDLYRSFSPPAYAMGDYDDSWRHFYGPSIQGARPVPYEIHLWNQFKSLRLLSFPLRNIPDAWYSLIRNREVDYPLSRYAALEPYRGHLATLIHMARQDGSRVLLLTQPSLYKPEMPKAEKLALRFGKEVCVTRKLGIFQEYPGTISLGRALDAFNASALEIAEEEQASAFDAAAVIPKDLGHFWDDVHFTREGAHLLADLTAGKIIEMIPFQDSENASARPHH